ncbi:MAG: biotin/lipoyl-containing protein [Candidatus Sericytochromatia bacterium]|nr:biotin/lipoyl-containing protein [Candidatus Sericytochromatia bacterium]
MSPSINANMAGTVLEVLVKPGDAVSEGMDVVCIESMKMQMFIPAEMDGTVKEVKIDTGDFVNEGDALIILE